MDKLDEELLALRAEYAVQLPGRMLQIENAWNTALRARWESGSLQTARRLVHGLGGSAGMYGYPELGRVARSLDMALTALIDSGCHPDAAQFARLVALVSNLQNVFAHSEQEPDCED